MSAIDARHAGRTSAGLDEERRFWERTSRGTMGLGSSARGSVVGSAAISFFALDPGRLAFWKIQGSPFLRSLVFKSGSRMSTTRVTLKKLHSGQPFFNTAPDFYAYHGSFARTFYCARISEIIAKLSQKYHFYLCM